MSEQEFSFGDIVENPSKPEWGPGKVIRVESKRVTVYFRDVEEEREGSATKQFVLGKNPLKKTELTSDPILDGVGWDTKKNVASGVRRRPSGGGRGTARAYWSHAQALDEFIKFFPKAFEDPVYFDWERNYKLDAHQNLLAELREDASGTGYADMDTLADRILHVESKTNLLFSLEKMALRDGLKDPRAAKYFFDCLHKLLGSPEPRQDSFDVFCRSVQGLPAARGKTDPFNWTVVTLFPFLAQPTVHMFMKPEFTNRAADRLGFNLNYDTRPNWLTYRRLLDLAQRLLDELKEYGARDFIDVQSFIYITGRLEDGTITEADKQPT